MNKYKVVVKGLTADVIVEANHFMYEIEYITFYQNEQNAAKTEPVASFTKSEVIYIQKQA